MNDVLYLDNLKSFSDLHALLYFWAQYLNTIIIWLSRILKINEGILSLSINQRIERKRHCIYPLYLSKTEIVLHRRSQFYKRQVILDQTNARIWLISILSLWNIQRKSFVCHQIDRFIHDCLYTGKSRKEPSMITLTD